jgi:branched-chain amino acid transport system permease protein
MQASRSGLIAGAVAVLISLVGMVATFGERSIISGWFTMGQVLFLAPIFLLTYSGSRRIGAQSNWVKLLAGALSGILGGAILALLVLLGSLVNLRQMFANASPELYEILTFARGLPAGLPILLLVCLALGLLAAVVHLLPDRIRKAVIVSVGSVLLIGLLRDLIMTVVNQWVAKAQAFPDWAEWARPIIEAIGAFFSKRIFAARGLRPLSAIILLLAVGALGYWRAGAAMKAPPMLAPPQMRAKRIRTLIGAGLVLVLLPPVLGIFFAEILDNVGLYILMGLGLNIVVGFAGLLDLGYVAFYAIGAYTMGVLTSPELGFFNLTYWQALPFALLASVAAGFILGLPVLKMRGDYLAIVTLGFGEIVRLLALSDWLRPWLGGTQGIQRIAQPVVGNLVLNSQQELYYLFLIGIAIVAFIAWRLKNSRLGRSWMALREDEDVAVAMGINHVNTKLLAFATGAAFSGLAGTIFAAKLQSVYPHSMNFLVSINVLSLIIIGGMGSIPGVFVGALVLIAAPELLREFAEYRYLVYGAVLVAMMLTKPEGLWPEERRRLELHEQEEEAPPEVLAAATPAAD